jgi:hypothetical protein
VYLAEIAPANRRGALAGLFQVDIVIGILLAHGDNFCAARFIAGAEARRYELAVSTLPATLLFTAYRHCSSCSSPRRLPRHRCAFNVRAVRISREHDGAAIHRGIFLDARNARSGTGTNERASSHVRAKILAPQYVMPRRGLPRWTIKDKENI